MTQVLKVEEWKSGSERWYVADTHTFTTWNLDTDDPKVLFIRNKISISQELNREKCPSQL